MWPQGMLYVNMSGRQPLPENPKAPAPRRRRLRACDSCRQRKIRCDNLPGLCRNCQIYGGNCLVTRDGRSVPRSNPGASRVCINRSGLKDSSRSSQDRMSSSKRISTVTPNTDTAMNTNQTPEFPSLPISRLAESVHGVVTTEVGRSPKNSKFAGITSSQVFAKSVEELFKPVAPHLDVMAFLCPTMTFSEELPLRSPIQQPIVDKITADPCLHHFFNTYHVLLPILDVKPFNDHYERFYQADRTLEPAVVSCVLLAIALGCEDSEVADLHFRAAWDLYGDLVAHPYLSSVQAFILMSLYLTNAGRENQAHLNIGIAARIAQSIGLHRSLSTHNHPHEFGFVLKEHSLRSCIWWVCYCLDKKLSFELGRPSAIRDDDCDADLPDTSQVFTPSSQAIVGSYLPAFFSSFINLCKRLSRICSDLFSINTPTLDENTIIARLANADTLLQDWRASLPEALVPDQDSFDAGCISSIARSILNCTYLNALVVVHRSSLLCRSRSHKMVNHMSRRIAGSDKICLDAAHNLAHETINLAAEHKVNPGPKWIHPYAINAVMAIFLSLMRSPRKWSREIDIALLRSMHHCFRNREDTELLCRFERFLETLTQAIEAPVSIENTASAQHAISSTQIQASASSSTGDRTQPSPGQTLGPLIQGLETDSEDHTMSQEEEIQFGGIFGDQYNLWNFQLWPLTPFTDGFGQGSRDLEMQTPLEDRFESLVRDSDDHF
ncbi:fungal-specific transcription factor domain-containing protein [Aspergillus californicus]